MSPPLPCTPHSLKKHHGRAEALLMSLPLPCTPHSLKKHHGRAEALLMAAWAVGCHSPKPAATTTKQRRSKPATANTSSSSSGIAEQGSSSSSGAAVNQGAAVVLTGRPLPVIVPGCLRDWESTDGNGNLVLDYEEAWRQERVRGGGGLEGRGGEGRGLGVAWGGKGGGR